MELDKKKNQYIKWPLTVRLHCQTTNQHTNIILQTRLGEHVMLYTKWTYRATHMNTTLATEDTNFKHKPVLGQPSKYGKLKNYWPITFTVKSSFTHWHWTILVKCLITVPVFRNFSIPSLSLSRLCAYFQYVLLVFLDYISSRTNSRTNSVYSGNSMYNNHVCRQLQPQLHTPNYQTVLSWLRAAFFMTTQQIRPKHTVSLCLFYML